MSVESASTFLTATILICAGLCLMAVALVFVNNLFSKFWKPVNMWHYLPAALDQPASRFLTPEEADKIAPTVDAEKKK